MTSADWWVRVVQARTERDDLRPQRVWTLYKGEHAAAIDLKAVPGIGAEVVLTVDGEMRKTRLFRSHEQRERVGRLQTRGHVRREGWCQMMPMFLVRFRLVSRPGDRRRWHRDATVRRLDRLNTQDRAHR
jgi:hypothetical protein